ncbi:ETS-related transcription factor Elf-1-like [Rhopilema esculentum]|uniref:ETS-related transcription factor Elf-1-like n=1 Tax=Rhopilema esculentum TaxID=499914 RepID=UPI0031D98E31
MTSTQLPGFTELSSAIQLNKVSLIEGVNHVFHLPHPLLADAALESPLPSIQSWYPSLMTSDGVNLRYISNSEPLVNSGSVAPSIFLSSASDRNYECVLDMEGQAISDCHIRDESNVLKDIKCEVDEALDEERDEEQRSDDDDISNEFERSLVSSDLGTVIRFGQEFTFENVMTNVVKERPKKKRRMLTTVATQTPPENSIYDDIEPVKLPVRYLYEFLELLLDDERYKKLIMWKDKKERVFMLIDHHKVAEMWGMHKRKKPMTYDKFSRALRFYYSKKILKKEPGRFTYKFLIQEGDIVQYMK